MMTKKAITVLSGGLDSCVATCVYAEDYEIHGITFNYGQKSFTHEVIDLPWLNKISNSSLTSDNEIPTLTNEELDDLDICEDTASSVWVPGRNIVFTSIATSYAESIGAEIIIVGWDKEEAATFPDNSKEFLESFNNMLNVGSPQNIEIKAPAIDLNKDEIVKLGDEIKAPMELSYSCYTGHEKHCGVCESCMRRKRAFKLADVKDPSEYNE